MIYLIFLAFWLQRNSFAVCDREDTEHFFGLGFF